MSFAKKKKKGQSLETEGGMGLGKMKNIFYCETLKNDNELRMGML